MLRTARSRHLHLQRRCKCDTASTFGLLLTPGGRYKAVWPFPWPDFHRLAGPSFAGHTSVFIDVGRLMRGMLSVYANPMQRQA